MNLHEFKAHLRAHPGAHVIIALPDGGTMPRHFHVTEVGHVAKQFVDCGGKFRASETCVLQTWVRTAKDDGHRLTAGKLDYILGLAQRILPSDGLPVEVEYEDGVVSQFPVASVTVTGAELTVHLGLKHTDCLAWERCGADGCVDETEDAADCCGAGAGAKSCC
jgi:hypothetical protein